jgi:arylformamidase
MQLYRGMDRAALDAAYDNGAAIGGAPGRDRMVADFTARSAVLVAKHRPKADLRYGDRPRNRIDYFAAGKGAPTLAFIHGGYWRATDKEMYSFVAEGPLSNGISVANVEYTLAPAASFEQIVSEIKQAIAWLRANLAGLGGDPDKLFLSGHSAGGHLTAMAINEKGVRAGLAISGVFDLEPIRLGQINETLTLDETTARRNSPQFNLPAKAPPLMVAVGGGELAEFVRQSREYHAAWTAKGLPGRYVETPGHNHFTVLDELASPGGSLTTALVDLIADKA